jgi:DNA-binding transcriptional ArsR family regulator
MSDTPTPREILNSQDRALEPAALKALAHPLRIQMFDLLSQYGPQTASSLAEELGESSGATSYHLRTLAKHGLIREVEGRGTARERWWERVPGSVNMVTEESLETPSGREAARVVISEFLRRRSARTERYFTHDVLIEDSSWKEVGVMSTMNLKVTPDQFAEIIAEVMVVLDAAKERYRDQSGPEFRPTSVQFDAFPLPEHPGA